MSQTPTFFQSAALKRAVSEAAVSAVQIDLYATNVTQQPLYKIDNLPQLDEHLKNAQSHANYWTGTLTQELSNSFGDVISFGGSFNTYYDQLSQLARQMPNDPSAKTNFMVGLRDLKNQIQDRLHAHSSNGTTYVGIYGLLTDCKTFQQDLLQDYQAFVGDSEALSVAIADTPNVDDQIKQLNASRKALIGRVTIDGLEVVGGVVLIAVGSLVTFATEGLAVGIVLMGATLVATGAGNLIPDAIELAGLDKEYGELLKKQALENENKAALDHTRMILSNFATQATDAQQAIGNLIAGWEAISDDIDQVINELNEAKDDALTALYSQVQSDLDAARDDWDNLVTFATNLQTRSKLKQTTPANL